MNLSSKMQLSTLVAERKQTKSSVLSAFHAKKGLNLETGISATLEAPKSKNAKAEEWTGSLRSSKTSSLRSRGGNSLSRLSESTWEEKAYEFIRKKKLKESLAETQQTTWTPESLNAVAVPSKCTENQIQQKGLISGLELKEKCQPVVDYLLSLGVEQSRLQRIVRIRSACFYVKIDNVKERLGYLMSLGMKNEDISKLFIRHPRVLEYTVDGMMTPRVQYLRSIGVPASRLGGVLTCCPSLLEYSVERSLKRRVRFLVDQVGIREQDIPKIVIRSPHVLTLSITGSLRPRIDFLLKNVGLSNEQVAKIITKHPQLLHYSIKNGIQPRINFFRNIGLSDPDIAMVICRCSQVLALSVEKSLKPKCDYLTKELKCGIQTIVSFPAYLSLSLEQRIQPRHEFMKVLGRLPVGSFPMCFLAVTDQVFCEKWAMVTLEEYHAFRGSLQLSNFAKKFARKNRLQFDR